MANHNLSNKINFFYIEDNVIDNLYSELNMRAKYQKVVFVEFEKHLVEQIKHKLKNDFFMEFVESINQVEFDSKTSCVVCADISEWNFVNAFCKKYNINAIFYLNTYQPLVKWNFKPSDNVLGFLIEKRTFLNSTKLNYFILDLSLIFMLNIENYLNSIFLNQNAKNISIDLLKLLDDFITNFDYYINDNEYILDVYYKCVMEIMYLDKGIFDNFCDENSIKNLCYKQHILSQILIDLYILFLSKINKNLTNFAVFLQKNAKNTKKMDKIYNFYQNFDENKFWFLTKNFVDTYIKILVDCKNNLKTLKQFFFKFNISEIYGDVINIDLHNFKNEIINHIANYDKFSFINIIENFGLLTI